MAAGLQNTLAPYSIPNQPTPALSPQDSSFSRLPSIHFVLSSSLQLPLEPSLGSHCFPKTEPLHGGIQPPAAAAKARNTYPFITFVTITLFGVKCCFFLMCGHYLVLHVSNESSHLSLSVSGFSQPRFVSSWSHGCCSTGWSAQRWACPWGHVISITAPPVEFSWRFS